MKVIIAGSRTNVLPEQVDDAVVKSGFEITEVVSGHAIGVDRRGEIIAKNNHIPVVTFIPDWNIGKQAGILRNIQMGDYADALIAVWDGESPGTKHMIDYMRKLNKPVFVYRVGEHNENRS